MRTSFLDGYMGAALWSSSDDDGDQLAKKYGTGDFALSTRETIERDTRAFELQNSSLLDRAYQEYDYNEFDAGADFLLTRNHEGAGFWDGDIGDELGKALTDAAHAFGSFELYVGDDGKIYAMGHEERANESVAREAPRRLPDGTLTVTKSGKNVHADFKAADSFCRERGIVWAQRPDGVYWANGTGGTYYLQPLPSGDYQTTWMETRGGQQDLGVHPLARAMQTAGRFNPVSGRVAAEARYHDFEDELYAAVVSNVDRATGLASVPDIIRSLPRTISTREAHDALLDLDRAGRIELRPVVGSSRSISPADRALGIPGPQGSILFYARPLTVGAAREDVASRGGPVCGPWVRMEKDPVRFQACMDLGARLGPIVGHDTLYRFLRPQMEREDVEVFYAVIVDTQMVARGYTEIARGARDSVMTPIADTARFAIQYAVQYGAMGLAVAHTHPSGKCKPSKADHEVTRAAQEMCKAVGICWLDHLVIGSGEYYSYSAKKSFRPKD